MNKILLHCCCGPCATASIERLLSEEYEVILYYSNSNIDTKEEFLKRLENLKIVAKYYDLKLLVDDYHHDDWLNSIKGYEKEPEHGKRCPLCFSFNLKRTYEKSKELEINQFTTTLTVSRFKNSQLIFSQGEIFPGFVKIDFKKKDGFSRSCYLSKELGLYRQQYCGCEFSKCFYIV